MQPGREYEALFFRRAFFFKEYKVEEEQSSSTEESKKWGNMTPAGVMAGLWRVRDVSGGVTFF